MILDLTSQILLMNLRVLRDIINQKLMACRVENSELLRSTPY